MRSFVNIVTSRKKTDIHGHTTEVTVIKPDYNSNGKDIMLKDGNFYAMLDTDTGMWETNESKAIELIDKKLYSYRDKIAQDDGFGGYIGKDGHVVVDCLSSSITNQIYLWKKWLRSLPPNHNYKPLDTDLTFKDDEVVGDMYRSKRLNYNIGEGSIENYDKLIGTLYSPDNRKKLEWSIGSIFAGDSKKIEKLVVLSGSKGTGKSTVIDLIMDLFDGYCGVFIAEALANKANQFSTEFLKDNPLVAVQDDGTLAKIDSPLINEIVSHKTIVVNEKNKSHYPLKVNTFLFLATNEKVDIHDTKMGIARRLLDVYPTGNKLHVSEYRKLVHNMSFELGAIAYRCLKVYKELGKEYYLNYVPDLMIDKTNYLRNFIFDNYERFIGQEYLTRDTLYKWYRDYCEESGISYIQKRIDFGEQIGEYFKDHHKVKWVNGKTYRHVYEGFREDLFNGIQELIKLDTNEIPGWLIFSSKTSKLDSFLGNCLAQYANEDGTPTTRWAFCTTSLIELDTGKLHFVKPPSNIIVIDFDIKDKDGNKDLHKNIEAASKWPKTYAELSKSGSGIHLHYIYNGDVSKLKTLYDKDIEIKVFKGNASLRRMVTRCNEEDIAIISSGLPIKEEKVLNEVVIKDEKHLRALIAKALRKEIEPYATKTSMDFIKKITDDYYKSGKVYDIRDMMPDIQAFANNSSHNALYCLGLINKINFMSDDDLKDAPKYDDDKIIFFDVEIFPNLFIICWKELGDNKKVVQMINPSSDEVAELCKHKLVGFNNRDYDNHILYARIMGYTNYELYDLSQRIITEKDRNAKFREAYKLSYTDIYDYASKKQGLKKWEIELGIHHQELGFKWDEPVPEDKWDLVAGYCCNDVIATEAVWNATAADFTARQILADIAGLSVNDTTNQCTTKIIVGDDRDPQSHYIYTDLSTIYPGYEFNAAGIDKSKYNEGAKIVSGKSFYRGEDPGEGGYVYATPGIHYNVGLLDVASMHPHSAYKLKIFGDYTERFYDLVRARLYIKHGDYESAGKLMDGLLKPYLKDKEASKQLAFALKIAINSVYGLTSAKFPNKLRDPRNVDNIVAKYGALFMINLKHEVQERGYTVVHIKTDSIKIANMDNKIKDFCMDYAKKYGFTFEHEATYEKICLVNESTYIAKDSSDHHWTATGAQFQVPYVFKTLFSHEPITFKDMCETKSVTSALYLDMNEGMPEGEHNYQFIGRVGSFVPVKDGVGGGILLREDKDKEGNVKYAAVVGTKKKNTKNEVYRWLDAEDVVALKKEGDVDTLYFNQMVEDAVDTISKYGDCNEFIHDAMPSWLEVPEGSPEEVEFPMNKPE